jgi:hypothetical protein
VPAEPHNMMPPRDFLDAGAALWIAVLADIEPDWELDAREVALLVQACRIADQLAELDAAVAVDGATVRGSRGQTVIHPGVSEGRALRPAQLRLLGAVELCDPASAIKASTPAQARARAAAQARWAQRNALKEAVA